MPNHIGKRGDIINTLHLYGTIEPLKIGKAKERDRVPKSDYDIIKNLVLNGLPLGLKYSEMHKIYLKIGTTKIGINCFHKRIYRLQMYGELPEQLELLKGERDYDKVKNILKGELI